jgi:ribonuclease III
VVPLRKSHSILNWLRLMPSPADRELRVAITRLLGQRPGNIKLYRLALKHSSTAMVGRAGGQANSPSLAANHNERLEFLGDAILGAVVADFLFKKFPFKDEGFLTEMRSRMVNGDSLGALAIKLGLNNLLQVQGKMRGSSGPRGMHGDALEALIGALYLDKGYEVSKRFIVQRIIGHHFDIEALQQADTNHKSRLIAWAQRQGKRLRFEITNVGGDDHAREFTATVYMDDEELGSGKGLSKKRAEQAAAEACLKLQAG